MRQWQHPFEETYHDAMWGEDCRPMTWADGKTYCTPGSGFPAAYSDAACTIPAGRDDSRYIAVTEWRCDD